MRGKKHKIKIEKIENKNTKTVTFTKRRNGLFSKASELCLLSPDTQIAILATPISAQSHASFYSFGHSSVDNVVTSFLNDQRPLPVNQEPVEGFWWEDKAFDVSENVEELEEAVNAISRMLNNVRLRLDDVVKSNQTDRRLGIHQEVEEVRNEETTTNQVLLLEGEASTTNQVLLLEGEASKTNQFLLLEGEASTTNQFLLLEGEASATASPLVVNENDDNLDEYFTDFDFDSLI